MELVALTITKMDPAFFTTHTFAGAFLAAVLAGGINAMAGGGTLIAFPILLALGLPPVTANATCTVGLLPGSLGSVVGYRSELKTLKKRYLWLLLPAMIGGGAGGWLLRTTPHDVFAPLIPFLILFATVLFVAQEPLQNFLKRHPAHAGLKRHWKITAIAVALLAAVYGGYFGAGMSIIFLSVLAMLGMKDMLQMSGFTNLLAFCVNGVAACIFVWSGMIDAHVALAMAIGAGIGGYGSTLIAHKIGRNAVRKFVIVVGFALVVVTLVGMWRGR